jgi:hypothetical protein
MSDLSAKARSLLQNCVYYNTFWGFVNRKGLTSVHNILAWRSKASQMPDLPQNTPRQGVLAPQK